MPENNTFFNFGNYYYYYYLFLREWGTEFHILGYIQFALFITLFLSYYAPISLFCLFLA